MPETRGAQNAQRKRFAGSPLIEAVYPLSPMQEGMLFHAMRSPGEHLYLEQFTCELLGRLNIDAFVGAWKDAVGRHPILRTGFVVKRDGTPVQVVHRQVALPVMIDDWSMVPAAEQEHRLAAFLASDRSVPFKTTQPPLMRIALIRRGEDRTRFVWTHHHILLDGWSLPLLVREILEDYDAACTGGSCVHAPVRPFGDYIAWLGLRDAGRAERYWRQVLADFREPTAVIGARSHRDAVAGPGEHRKESLACSPGLLDTAGALARELGVTVASVIQAAWALVLARYTGDDDIVFGTTVSGRPPELAGVERMIGLFINTLPIRVRVPRGDSLADLVRKVHAAATGLQEFEYTPLVAVQGWSAVPAGTPLFSSIVVVENYPVDPLLEQRLQSIAMSDVGMIERTNYPLTLAAICRGELTLELAYTTACHDACGAAQILAHLRTVLEEGCLDPAARLWQVPMFSVREDQLLTQYWPAQGGESEPDGNTIVDMFTAAVRRSPARAAVVCGPASVTYADLADRSDALAVRLRRAGVGPERTVAVQCERSPWLVVAFLAVLKSGGVYLPLDPSLPTLRRRRILDAADPAAIITDGEDGVADADGRVLVLRPDMMVAETRSGGGGFRAMRPLPGQAAYMISTSGSTGEPKSVVVPHDALESFVRALSGRWPGHDQARVLQFASPAFDASIAEMVLALCSGATLIQVSHGSMYDPAALAAVINGQGVTMVTLPPPILSALPDGAYPSLKVVCAVADACPWSLVDRWSSSAQFYNGYGPTETAIAAAIHRHVAAVPDAMTVPIGKPLAGVRLYVCDPHGDPVPPGEPGELYIGGAGVARGYAGRPELTADRFLPDRFGSHPGRRVYRTGDRVRYHEDGTIEFLGRLDRQVKVHGLRIEPEEIEVVLGMHPAVREAAVTAVSGTEGPGMLAGYVTCREGMSCDPDDVRGYLQQRLPAYMVPPAITVIGAMPRTTTGKIDRGTLAATARPMGRRDTTALTWTEDVVAGIWISVLHCPNPGREDDFFALGGHSLLATRVATRLREAFGFEVPIDVLFEQRRLSDLGAWIDAARSDGVRTQRPVLRPVPRAQTMPASFPQRRIWFLERLQPDRAFFVVPCAVTMRGRLDTALLSACLQECVMRHESLRTTFLEEDGEPVMVIAPRGECPVQILDRSDRSPEQRADEVAALLRDETARPFDLSHGPLVRALIIRTSDDEHVVALTMHHAIADGWSAGILLAEVRTLYAAHVSGVTPTLPPLRIQYADVAVWQQALLTGPHREDLVRYWTGKLAGIPAGLDILPDEPRPPVATSHGAMVSMDLEPVVTDAIHLFSAAEAVTPYMTMLAAFHLLLHRTTGQETIVVGSPVAGRSDVAEEGVIGCFVNTLPLRADVIPVMSMRDLIRQVRTTCLDAFLHQDLPFELMVEELHPPRDLSRTPVFQAAFVFQNLGTVAPDLPGVTATPLILDNGTAKYELTMTVVPAGDHLTVSMEYNTDLFSDQRARSLLRQYTTLLRACLAEPGAPVENLPLMDTAEFHAMTVAWNATERPYPDGTTAHAWFERVAAVRPDHPALEWHGETRTYAQLNRDANRFAHILRRRSICEGDVVGICLDRSPGLIAGVLGIMKAGGAFLPLDPAYPPDRIRGMCDDARVRAILTTRALRETIGLPSESVVAIDDGPSGVAGEVDDDPPMVGSPDGLAYVIFTSGSTGRPKGSMLHHRGLCNLAAAQQSLLPLGPGSRVLQFASPSFDASVWELVMALLSGGTLVLADREALITGQGLRDVLQRDSISVITLPPSALAVLPDGHYPALRSIVVAGERCPADLVDRWGAGRQFVNAYGPTETTVCASTHECVGRYRNSPPIGRPLANVRLYILDGHGAPVPPGVPGELFIGGAGVAWGYCGRPDLTADRFVPDPFSNEGGRLYRSGDLCRYRHDAGIEFLGRSDTQVKVRGYRIEPGEIRAALGVHPQIAVAEVVVREDLPGDQRIIAYLVPRDGTRPDPEDLRALLHRTLPRFMIPAAFVFLEALPLTPAGKVDLKALPAPPVPVPVVDDDVSGPADPIEADLAAVCAELLGVPRVAVHDNFFDLGGHSLLATRFIARIRDRYGIEIPVRALFEDPTVAGVAAVLRASRPPSGNDPVRVHAILRLLETLSEDEAQQMLDTSPHVHD